MSLHTDWTDAKKDSKAKFKTALKAQRDALEKKIKDGDAKARAKVLDQNLADLGMGQGDDLDKYFRFREDFGPNLDKLEKADAGAGAARKKLEAIKHVDEVIADPALSKVMTAVAKRMQFEEFWGFITVGWKADPVKAYAMFIAPNAPLLINIDDAQLDPLRQLAGNPAQFKAQGPALLKRCRDAAVGFSNGDVIKKFKASPEAAAMVNLGKDTTAIKKAVTDTIASYRQQIKGYESKWKNIQPDFRRPLLDALDSIEAKVADL
ncbi:MAG: hypothetical protein KIT35_11720 [Piscinibacter sp.]|uniref:hypothetical protein n=1 Tax=Piscinibacter sp. TaxID=1903157 RepID=UPI002583F7EE|nr:hypothetical protein [Piscinibacter sp.]MCW5664494.1 hypothetical protein [Piscinibacter sp.]